jgi:hypothetical protein
MRCIVKPHRLFHLNGSEAKVLLPAYEADEEVFDSLKSDNMYKCDIRRARNPQHHRKGFALIKLIFDSQERYRTIEDLLVELKLMTGWYREHIRPNGELIYVPKSISFADMDQIEFEAFYELLIDIAIQQFGLKEAVEFIR